MPLDPEDLDLDPLAELRRWIDDAAAAGAVLPDAFALATTDERGAPSVRYVLLRGLGADGLRWFTNFESRKGRDLAANPRAAAAFWWPSTDRQVRVAGSVRRLPREDALAYWASRPRLSRLSALASQQGAPVANREELEARVAELAARHPDDEVPLPDYWGGYLLVPETVEFWESRADRLHDRVEYVRAGTVAWRRRRLQP